MCISWMVVLAWLSCMTKMLMSYPSPEASLAAVVGEGTSKGWCAEEVPGSWEARRVAGSGLGEEKLSLYSTGHQGNSNESKEERLAYRIRA